MAVLNAHTMRDKSVTTEFAIGGAAGLLDCTLFHWIDTIKVRRQDNRPLLMNLRTGGALTLADAANSVPRFLRTALASLYAGFSTNLSLKLPYMALMFAFDAANKRLLNALRPEGSGSPVLTQLVSAGLVGLEVSLLLSPLEMVRIQGQNCGKGGLLEATRAVLATAAVPSSPLSQLATLSRGLPATSQREIKYCLGQFFLCEQIAAAVAERTGGGDGAPPTMGAQIVGAVAGGAACTIVSHPDDVIKTRMQTHLRGSPHFGTYTGYWSTGRHIAQQEGVARGLLKGAFIRCALRVPLGLSVIMISSQAMRAAVVERREGSP